jgi:hypothetical protein
MPDELPRVGDLFDDAEEQARLQKVMYPHLMAGFKQGVENTAESKKPDGRHELVEGVEDRLGGVPPGLGLLGRWGPVGVGPEAGPPPVVLDVPGLVVGTVPRLRLTHEQPPP